MYHLGKRLQEARIQRGMTQKVLAQRINKSVATVSSYETGVQMPPLDVLITISYVLNISLDSLAGLDADTVYSTRGLTAQQKEILELLFSEFQSDKSNENRLSEAQTVILQKLILYFSGVYPSN